ncbi:hypothetical protein E3T46_12105 [Cryobacterium sp. Hh11]|uniref:hypothetical protein n=1 Tax=Cryobacterium sp. Hh11 TaxID=2555868 RepID=UPI00106D505D|nr:hypothetical protein [Cryobacterium sp. Hh11]TFD50075.1 hypothetical protein E3T46_12105 [Cryobacterium sp. Hh11]
MKLMLNRKKAIIGAGGVAVALTMALAALGPTGAYFTDTEQGNITGNLGSIEVTSENTELAYTNLLPGEPQTVTADFKNTGTNNQDVWVVFNNVDALRAINNLGKYGNFTVKGSGTEVFSSTNLQDGEWRATNSCGGFFEQANRGCWPLLEKYQLASNLAPQATGDVSFTFAYGAAMTSGAGAWNQYPVQYHGGTEFPAAAGYGLPYQIVATQVGHAPGVAGVN